VSDAFSLAPQLVKDCELIVELPLSSLLLMNDANYPWFILVPRVLGARELIDLSEQQQQQLLNESNRISHFILTHFKAEKLNIATLGNVVEQLHIHHVGRFEEDVSWPKPVWGAVPAKAYSGTQIDEIKKAYRDFMQ
jgi:diadenosine tetraphosphate (Ap4A) HIT family hydrolase